MSNEAQEEASKAQETSMGDLFDDDDESEDEEMDMDTNTTSNNAQATGNDDTNKDMDESKTEGRDKPGGGGSGGNGALFGSDDSDDDDDDDDDDKKGDGGNQETSKDTPITPGGNNSDEEENDDEDAEFKDDSIIGKKRVDPPPSAIQTPVSTKKENLTVPDMPLPQFNKQNQEESTNKTFHITQLPKILGVQTNPFSSKSYQSKDEEEQFKGRVHNIIRWRYKTTTTKNNNGSMEEEEEEEKKERDEVTNKVKKESNATIVKWSDGSFGLRVGNELFDMDEFSFLLKDKKSKKKNGSSAANATANDLQPNAPKSKDYLYLTQKATPTSASSTTSANTTSTTTILQAVTSLTSKFIPRPSSLQSAAHKTFALESRSRTMKRAKIAEYVSFVDPEQQKMERIRNKDELMKHDKRNGGGRRSGGGMGGGRRRMGMTRDYMEDDEYDDYNVGRMRRNVMEDDMDYGDDDMMSDDEDEWSKRKKRALDNRKNKRTPRKKGRFDDDSDEEEEDQEEYFDEEEEDEGDDDEEEIIAMKKKSSQGKKKSSAALFDDDDESE